MPPFSDDARREAALLQTMTLLATLSTAGEVEQRLRDRRAGRDPSVQEAAAVATAGLVRACRELDGRLVRLQAHLVLARDEDGGLGLIRRVGDLLALGRIAHLLQVVHQRLLSLYPGVDEHLVEEARQVLVRCEDVRRTDDLEATAAFVDRALALTARVAQALGS